MQRRGRLGKWSREPCTAAHPGLAKEGQNSCGCVLAARKKNGIVFRGGAALLIQR
jgi:hypothetical protein